MERRRTMRRVPGREEPIAQVRLRAGRQLVVLDVSSAGVLVEGGTRLLPGTHVDVHVVTPTGRVLVRSRIIRAFVSIVVADSVTYRGALVFDRGIETDGYVVPQPAVAPGSYEGNEYPDVPDPSTAVADSQPIAKETR